MPDNIKEMCVPSYEFDHAHHLPVLCEYHTTLLNSYILWMGP